MQADDWVAQGLPRSGESGRVAARVRALVGGTGAGGDDELVDDGVDGRNGVPRLPSHGDAPRAQHGRVPLWRRLTARVPVRVDPGRRGALAVGVAVLVAALVTGLWLMAARPRSAPVSATVPDIPGSQSLVGTSLPSATSSAAAAAATTAPTRVVVDVAGKVHRPGVYRLPADARVDDAIGAAGGALHGVDLSSLNLAARLTDGQQIAVGVRGSTQGGGAVAGAGDAAGGAVAGGGAGGGAASGSATIIDLNTATLDQLETLPGVGPVLGQHILDYRTQHGSFTDVAQLQDVSGIGDVKFAALQPLVTV